jgi:hypothetical protein
MPNDMNPALEVLRAEVPMPQDSTIIGPAARLLAGIQDLVIDSDAVYEAAAADLAAAKTMRKSIEEDRKSLTRPLDDLKAKIMDKYRPALEICAQVADALEPKMLTYRREQEAKAAAERQRLEEIARQERERLEREAMEARRRAEEDAKATREAAAAEAQQLVAEGREREAQERREAAEREAAEKLAGAEAEALALHQQAEVTAAAPSAITPPKVAGTSVAGTYKGRVTDPRALRRFVGENPMYDNLVIDNESAINALARSMGKNLTIPGIEVYLDQSIRSRRAA